MSEAVSSTMTGTCKYVLQDLPHLRGGAQMHGAQAMDVPHPDIHTPIIPLQNATPLRGLATIRSTPTGNLTGIDSLIERPATQTRPLVLMRNREGDNPLPTDPTMTLTAEARVPMPNVFHSKSMRTKDKHGNLMIGTCSTPLRVATRIMADFLRETTIS